MQIESTAIALRRREPWEAIDLGFAMQRQWWRPVYAAWAVTFVPVACFLAYAFRDDPVLAVLGLWWLKPVFDRVVLHVLSRAVFGDVPPVKRLCADWRDYLWPGLVAGQLWARVDLARSFDLPVWQLERVSGRAASRRRAVLQRRARYHAVWLTGMCAIFESVLILGVLLLADLATPAMSESGWMFERLFGSGPDTLAWGMEATLVYALAVTVVEPFYVAAGFSLYLNRRTLLEGWDIELELRRCAARAAAGGKRGAVTAAILVALLSPAAFPQPAAAGEPAAAKSAQREIAEVLKEPEFPHARETWTWRVRWPEWDLPEWLRWPEWLRFKGGGGTAGEGPWAEILATLVKVVFWTAVAVALAWALYQLARRLPYLIEPRAERIEPPPVLFGLDIAPETLPPDIAGTAARLLGAGRMREALSLLYRGALSSLVHAGGIALQPGDTERDCVHRARAVLPREGHAYFVELVAAWETTAYAGRLPDAGRAQALVASWTAHFAPVLQVEKSFETAADRRR
jgi:hypothetical protein